MSANPAFLFAPGAGAGSSSTWMRAWAARLQTMGPVTSFDYPYRLAGRKAPDRPEILVRAHTEALAEARRLTAEGEHGQGPMWFLAGKSMGSRIGCHVAVDHPNLVSGVICFGYPLVSPGNGAMRDQVLLALTVPALLVQGTRDPLCPLDRLRTVCAGMRAPVQVLEVEGGNHSLEISRPKSRPGAQDAEDLRVLTAIRRFVADCAPHAPLLA
jgi:predicted alpha/beta-hydrolase family hydrolase